LHGLASSLLEKLGAHCGGFAVEQGAKRRRDTHGAVPGEVALGQIGEVENDANGYVDSPATPTGWHGEVLLAWQDIGELVQPKSSFVAERSFLSRPEPGDDVVLVLGCRELDEPEEATRGAFETSPAHVVVEKGIGVACGMCLSARQVAGLSGCYLVDSVP
jgi:hypothetical protein